MVLHSRIKSQRNNTGLQTPCGVADVEFVDPREPIKVVPILRAGLVLIEHVASVLPAIQTYHLGFDEETLQPTLYFNKLPEKLPETARVLVADPMLATGGTMIAAIEELIKRGLDRVVAALAAPPALQKLSEKFPGLINSDPSATCLYTTAQALWHDRLRVRKWLRHVIGN